MNQAIPEQATPGVTATGKCPICKKNDLDGGERVCGECKGSNLPRLDPVPSLSCPIHGPYSPWRINARKGGPRSTGGMTSKCPACVVNKRRETRRTNTLAKKQRRASGREGAQVSASSSVLKDAIEERASGSGPGSAADVRMEFSPDGPVSDMVIAVDLSDLPDIFGALREMARDRERTMAAQVRYWLKRLCIPKKGAIDEISVGEEGLC